MQPTAVQRDRTLIAIVSVIIAIVVIAVIVVFTRGGPVEVDPTSPEGTVQSYTQAIIAGDTPAALDLLTSNVREDCIAAEPYLTQDLRMTVVSTKISGDTATVRVSMLNGGGIFDGMESGFNESFSLVKSSDGWEIVGTPWQLMICYSQETGE